MLDTPPISPATGSSTPDPISTPALGSTGATSSRVGRYRYVVVGVAWFALFLGAFDRSAVSLLIVDPGFLTDMGLKDSPERQGLVMTALLIAYALSNIFVSPAADRWGPRRVMTAIASGWTVAALWLGSAGSYTMLIIGRVLRGTAEGPLFPVTNRYVRNWFPPSERGGANAIWNSGQRLGLALAVPALSVVIAAYGWRTSFLLQAALILVLLVPAVWLLTGDNAEDVRRVGKDERTYIASARSAPARAGSARGDLSGLLRNPDFWLAVLYHFSVLGVYFGLVTWLPKYLKDGRGFDLGAMVLFAALPHILSAITGLGFGFWSDRFQRRAPFCLLSLAVASLAVCLSALAPDPIVCAVLMIVGIGAWGSGPPSYYAIIQRIVPAQLTATGVGIDNGLSNFGSALAPAVVGFLIGTTGSYLAGLLFLAGVGAVGSVAALVLVLKRY